MGGRAQPASSCPDDPVTVTLMGVLPQSPDHKEVAWGRGNVTVARAHAPHVVTAFLAFWGSSQSPGCQATC